jgi:Fe-S-cluster-containing dehydrogenase component
MTDSGRRGFLRWASLGVLGLAAWEVLEPVAAAAAAAEPAPDGKPRLPRWALVVDTKACLSLEGCDKCAQACHSVHNVPAVPDARHEVRWMWREKFRAAFPDQEPEHVAEALTSRTLPVLCNHCENPPCARVCPTEATWRRPDGIVMMDWHRCIGCRYCVAACPYGSRSFNFVDPRPHLAKIDPSFPTRTKGVVEKCTFCDERLARGLGPACAEACPRKALVFGDLSDPRSPVREALRSRYALRRRPGLGTNPHVYYLV